MLEGVDPHSYLPLNGYSFSSFCLTFYTDGLKYHRAETVKVKQN